MPEISEILSKQNAERLFVALAMCICCMQAKDRMGCDIMKEVLELHLFWWQLAFTSTGRWHL